MRRHRPSPVCSRAVAFGLLTSTWTCGLVFVATPSRPQPRATASEATLQRHGVVSAPLPELGIGARSGRTIETSSVAVAAAAATPTVDASTWMDCDVRFIAAEAHAARISALKADMQAAAEATDFVRAGELKQQITSMSETGPPVAPPPESWLIGGEELFGTFGRFLQTRGLQPQDVDIDCETTADGPTDWGSRPCEECLKLHSGGPYGSMGVVTPAYPQQEMASGCLALSQRSLDVDLSAYHDRITGSLGDDTFDASADPSSIAFCRVK